MGQDQEKPNIYVYKRCMQKMIMEKLKLPHLVATIQYEIFFQKTKAKRIKRRETRINEKCK